MTEKVTKRRAYASDKSGTRWIVTTTYADEAGEISCVGIAIEPFRNDSNSPFKISASIIEDLPIQKIIDDQLNPDFGDPGRTVYDDLKVRPPKKQLHLLAQKYVESKTSTASESPKRGRPFSHDTDSLVEVAIAYWDGGSRPIQSVAKACNLPYSTAANKVAHARNAGMLPGSRKVAPIKAYLRPLKRNEKSNEG